MISQIDGAIFLVNSDYRFQKSIHAYYVKKSLQSPQYITTHPVLNMIIIDYYWIYEWLLLNIQYTVFRLDICLDICFFACFIFNLNFVLLHQNTAYCATLNLPKLINSVPPSVKKFLLNETSSSNDAIARRQQRQFPFLSREQQFSRCNNQFWSVGDNWWAEQQCSDELSFVSGIRDFIRPKIELFELDIRKYQAVLRVHRTSFNTFFLPLANKSSIHVIFEI